MSTTNSNNMVARTLKFLLNFLIWIFIIPAIIDLIRYITANKLISDSVLPAQRPSNHNLYFGMYFLYSLTWMLFGIGLICGMIYIVLKGQNLAELFYKNVSK